MRVDLDSLACFVAAAELASFRAGAQRVHLSPAAFGERIKRLEDDVGAVLFERTTRKVALTASGGRLLAQARRTLEEAERCRAVAREASGPMPFELVLGTRYELGLSWLVPQLASLRLGRPERKLHLFFGDSPDLLARVRTGALDACISSARLASTALRHTPLHEERYLFVASPKLIARAPLRLPAHAREHNLIDAHPDLPLFRYWLDGVPAKEAWSFKELEYLGTIAAIRLRVLEGAGVAVLPEYFVRDDLAKKRLLRLLPRVALGRDLFRLIWREGHPREQELLDLAAELRAHPVR